MIWIAGIGALLSLICLGLRVAQADKFATYGNAVGVLWNAILALVILCLAVLCAIRFAELGGWI